MQYAKPSHTHFVTKPPVEEIYFFGPLAWDIVFQEGSRPEADYCDASTLTSHYREDAFCVKNKTKQCVCFWFHEFSAFYVYLPSPTFVSCCVNTFISLLK